MGDRPVMTHEVLLSYFQRCERDLAKTLDAILADYPEAAEPTPSQQRGLTPGTTGLEALEAALDTYSDIDAEG